MRLTVPVLLFFASGATGLIYQLLWMRELSLLFGNSTQAAAATLAAFFAGLAAGNWVWGRRADRLRRPLQSYALLEAGVAVSSIAYFAILFLYGQIYGTLFASFHQFPVLFLIVKFLLALVLLVPPAFFMGGTLPVMSAYVVRARETLGRHAALFYGINTLGAALGVVLTGFLLPSLLGYTNTYLANMGLTLIVAATAFLWDRRQLPRQRDGAPPGPSAPPPQKTAAGEPVWTWRTLYILAGISGFTALALQVLWMRMFAQVLQNSIYSFAAILAVFLAALALGGFAARTLARRALPEAQVLIVAATAAGLLIAASPLVFYAWTDGLSYLGGAAGFVGYMARILALAGLVVGLPVAVLGVIFPYLFKLAEGLRAGPGDSVGRLVSINTLGAIAGSLTAGFLLLDWLGLWPSLRLLAAAYLLTAAWLTMSVRDLPSWTPAGPIAGLILLLSVLDTTRLPVVRTDPVGRDETLIDVLEGSAGTVAVVKRGEFLRTKLNNWYTLGGTGDMATQSMQTHLPMVLHGAARRVFYLGMGTGITAGTALNYPVEELLVAEIVPSAITASRRYFAPYVNGLHTDERALVVAEDGRNVLRGTDRQFDLVISDLFIPWKEGTGNLYSVDHYRMAASKLAPAGLYVQWIPLFQVTEAELAVIAKSMTAVFPQVTAWHGNFSADRPVLGLVGHRERTPLAPDAPIVGSSRAALAQWADQTGDAVPLLTHYVGQIGPDNPKLADSPLHSDNRPVIDYLAPRNHRLEKEGKVQWLEGRHLLTVLSGFFGTSTGTRDPYLSALNPAWGPIIAGGDYLVAANVLADEGEEAESHRARQVFAARLRQASAGDLVSPPAAASYP